jgi:hypothetical protein
MVLFTPSVLENWKQLGYRYILIMPGDKYGVLRPLYNDRPAVKGYTIEFSEIPLLHLSDNYFLVKEKDSVGSAVS